MKPWRRIILAVALVSGTLWAQPLAAQTPPDGEAVLAPDEETDGPVRPDLPSPGGAFLRSLIVPGWGQAVYDAHLRGGVFFAAQSGSWFMIAKSAARLGEARNIETRRTEVADAHVRDSLLLAASEDEELARRYEDDPLSFERDVLAGIEADEGVQDIRELVGARRQQREDWIALTIFMTLASGVDAFVNAHLSDSPARVVAEPRPGGGVSVGLRIPVASP